MDKRLQRINNDTVLEITEVQPVKRRISENGLLRKKAYLEEAISNFQTELDGVMRELAELDAEKNK